MIPVEPVSLRASRVHRVVGVAVLIAALLCLPAGAAPMRLPPGAVLTPPPGAVVVPGPVRAQAKRQSGNSDTAGSTPTVSVQVVAPAAVAPGKEFTYRIVAENTSDAPAHHVYVKATLSRSAKVGNSTPPGEVTSPEGAPPEKATVVTWNLGTLAAGVKREQTLTVSPTGDEEVFCSARVQFEHGQLVRTRIGKREPAPAAPLPPAPPDELAPVPPMPAVVARPAAEKVEKERRPVAEKVEKERQPPASPALRLRQIPPAVTILPPNETFTYEYEVTNVGTAPAKDVVLEATPAKDLVFMKSKPSTPGTTPITWKFAELAPGAKQKVEYTVAGDKVGDYLNRAVVTAAGGPREQAEHRVQIGLPKLLVRVTGPSQRGALRDATYRISVKNTGTAPALEVELSDEPIKEEKVSDAVKAVRAADGGKIAGNIVRWSLGTIAPGGERTVGVVLQAKGPGEFTYLCTARSKDMIEQGRARTKFVEPAALEVELDRITDATTVKVGAEVAYSLRLRNGKEQGNTNVDVLVTVPKGLELVELKAPTSSRPAGPEIRLPRIGRLSATGDTAILRFRTLEPGDAKITVRAASAQTGPNAATLEEIVKVAE